MFEVSRVFQISFKDVYKRFLKEVLRLFKESFKGVSRKMEGCFKGILSGF